jgi:nicotinate-nucleotide pyrophosphorylase (carboxylating)
MDVRSLPGIEALLAAALQEDLGRGDVTTRLTVPADRRGRAALVAKQDAVIAGLPLLEPIFRLAGGGVSVEPQIVDGDRVAPDTVICRLEGAARVLLSGERLGLNFLQQLSGVATLTRRFVDAVAGTKTRIADTRKTVPGLRLLQKYAVRVGGGINHRFGLDDGILIKDNHIAAAGGLGAAVRSARAGAPHGLKVEVECETLAQVDEALAAGADVVLLDNMGEKQLAQAVARIGGRAITEASGGVSLESVRSLAATGVDIISVGALTHSAPAIDISMGWES